mgnify:CR=1 FL=1
MKVCEKCLLSDNIPSVRINSSGLCNYCDVYPETKKLDNAGDDGFSELLNKYGHKKYQVLMAYSGGKDSTYTLKLIKEKYDASILAVTFNNCFLSESCMKNISVVTDRLGVESLIVKYPVGKLINAFKFAESGGIFPRQSLERASSICNLCIMLVKNLVYYEAIVRDIPIICFGWTPGQVEAAKPVLKLNHRMVTKVFENIRSAVTGELGGDYARYFIDEKFMNENEDRIPYLYYPFVDNTYDEEKIVDEIREIGWEPPRNTDGNSSNCLLNSYANQRHLERYGYHPYAFEISSLVREGYMTREEGSKKLENVKNDRMFEIINEKFQNT